MAETVFDNRENIIGELHTIICECFPCPYHIADADLNCDNPDEVTVIDNYRVDDFQRTLMSAIRVLERMSYYERGLK